MSKRIAMLTVNGEACEVAARTTDTLLDILRDGLQLTGSKRGCNQGVCGACTVLVDGEPIRSCLSLAVDMEGEEIMTVEGLGTRDVATPVQQALVEAGAIQCGYCTPGMVVALTALLEANPRPGPAEIRHGIAGNICRCSGYVKIVEAVLRATGYGRNGDEHEA